MTAVRPPGKLCSFPSESTSRSTICQHSLPSFLETFTDVYPTFDSGFWMWTITAGWVFDLAEFINTSDSTAEVQPGQFGNIGSGVIVRYPIRTDILDNSLAPQQSNLLLLGTEGEADSRLSLMRSPKTSQMLPPFRLCQQYRKCQCRKTKLIALQLSRLFCRVQLWMGTPQW